MKAIVITFCMFCSTLAFGQINVTLLHQLVEDSKNEHDRQAEAKNGQAINAINEEVNRNLMDELKVNYGKVQERFSKINLLSEGVGLAASADPLIRSILDHQSQILFYCQKDPFLIPLALETETLFVTHSYSLMNYLIGLMASVGELNQMKVSERRLLLQHAVNELRALNRISGATARTLASQNSSKGHGFPGYLPDGSGIMDELMINLKILAK